MDRTKLLRARQKLGKYRVERRLADGPRCTVYRAYDTIHGCRVALKIPHPEMMDEFFLADFRREAKLATRMEHPNVLPILNASYIDGHFVIAMPLGLESLADRLARRISTDKALDYTAQMLAALSHAHSRRIIHCDVKPDNFILFPDNRIRLTDFGFSKIALRTVKASGSGTVGYLAPEQALGRPMFQSDVFSLGLVIYRMFSGILPEWPYTWPPAGLGRLRARVRPPVILWLRRAIELRPQARYRDAVQMEQAFQRLRGKARRRQA
jgi:eukaryotic-like serine/threonine-protein kinase